MALLPIVSPVSVTVTKVPGVSCDPVAATIMEDCPGEAGVRIAPAVDDVALGVEELAKKFVG